MVKKLIIAHRGASKAAPENTLQAFQRAIDMGADMIETDIRKTKDGVLILHHDPDIHGDIINQLIWQEVQALNPAIPTLEQALQLIAGKIKLDAELKEPGYERGVVELLLKYLKPEEFVVTSFIEEVLQEIKKAYPNIRVGLLLGNRHLEYWLKVVKYIFNRKSAKVYGFWALSVPLYTFRIFKLLPRLSSGVLVWTADSEQDIIKLSKSPDVAGIITNVPDKALNLYSANL